MISYFDRKRRPATNSTSGQGLWIALFLLSVNKSLRKLISFYTVTNYLFMVTATRCVCHLSDERSYGDVSVTSQWTLIITLAFLAIDVFSVNFHCPILFNLKINLIRCHFVLFLIVLIKIKYFTTNDKQLWRHNKIRNTIIITIIPSKNNTTKLHVPT